MFCKSNRLYYCCCIHAHHWCCVHHWWVCTAIKVSATGVCYIHIVYGNYQNRSVNIPCINRMRSQNHVHCLEMLCFSDWEGKNPKTGFQSCSFHRNHMIVYNIRTFYLDYMLHQNAHRCAVILLCVLSNDQYAVSSLSFILKRVNATAVGAAAAVDVVVPTVSIIICFRFLPLWYKHVHWIIN